MFNPLTPGHAIGARLLGMLLGHKHPAMEGSQGGHQGSLPRWATASPPGDGRTSTIVTLMVWL